MSTENNGAKFRVEVVNKNQLRDLFSQTQQEVKRFAAASKTDLQGAGKEITALAKTQEDASHRIRDATGRFTAGMGSASQAMSHFGINAANARRHSTALAGALGGELRSALGSVGTTATTAARGLAALTGIGAGIGVVSAAKSIIDLDDGIAGLAATAGLADDKIAGLRSQILDTSTASKVFGNDLTEALTAFVAKTGDIDTARKNLKLYADTARATRASVVEIANIGADLGKLGIKDQGTAFSILAKQSDVGSVELKDLVSQGPRLLSAFMASGLKGERGLREGGALAQVGMGSIGNVERTSTSVEAVFRDLIDKSDILRDRYKVNVFDQKTHLANNPIDVVMQAIRRTKGRQDELASIFGAEAIRTVNPLATEFREKGGFPTFERFRDVDADPALMERKRQLNLSTAAAKIEASQIQVQADAYRNFASSVNNAVDHLDKFTAVLNWVGQHPVASAGIGVGGMVAAGLARRAGSAALNWAGRRIGLGGVGGTVGQLAAAAGAEGTPVYVTNWPAGVGGLGGVGGTGAAALGGAARAGAGGVAAIAGSAAAVVLAGVAGYELGSWLDERFGLSDKIAGIHGNGYREGDAFAKDPERRRDAAAGEAGIARKLKARVASGELSAADAAAQFERYAISAEGAGDVHHISDGRTRELFNVGNHTYGLNARSLRDDVRNTAVDAAARRARLQREGVARNGAEATFGSLSDNVGVMAELLGGTAARAGVGRFMTNLRGSTEAAFAPVEGSAVSFGGAGAEQLSSLLDALRGTLAGEFRDALQSLPPPSLTVNIDGEGEGTLESNTGVRSSRVMVRRTQGGG